MSQVNRIDSSINRNSSELHTSKDANEPLLDKNLEEDEFHVESFGCWYAFKRYFNLTVSKERRKLNVVGTTVPGSFMTNRLNN